MSIRSPAVKVQWMATGQITDERAQERPEYAGVLRIYELAKRQEWQVRDLPWNEQPPIPEGRGSPQRQARHGINRIYSAGLE